MTLSMARSHSGKPRRPRESGAARVGVLLFIAIVVLGTYVAVTGGRIFVHYSKFQDQMDVHGRQAQTMDDEVIRTQLQQTVDQLGLPADAKTNIRIQRQESGREIRIESRYEEIIELPFFRWAVKLHPRATVSY